MSKIIFTTEHTIVHLINYELFLVPYFIYCFVARVTRGSQCG